MPCEQERFLFLLMVFKCNFFLNNTELCSFREAQMQCQHCRGSTYYTQLHLTTDKNPLEIKFKPMDINRKYNAAEAISLDLKKN